jgi:hypothetical protein
MNPASVAHVGLHIGKGVDWNGLLQQAHRHSVLPLLRENLHSHFWPEIPVEIREYLTEASQRTQRRNLALTAELLRILAILAEAGVAAIPFKGPMLAVGAYANTAFRMFADLDILVREVELAKVRQLLVAQGYIPVYTMTGREERAYLRDECAFQLRNPRKDTVVELHWRLTERYLSINLPIDEFWNRSVQTVLAGRTVVTFALEDLFLYLCIHAGKHEWERLEWLCSVAAVIERYSEIQWPAVERYAREHGIDRLVRVTLLLANALLECPVPQPYRDSMALDPAAHEIAREVMLRLFGGPKHSQPHKRAHWYLFLLRTRERWSDKLRIMAFTSLRLPHPAAEPLFSLPPQLACLHYILRPIRLLGAVLALTCRHWTTLPKPTRETVALPPASSECPREGLIKESPLCR